jgi:hypothetical protein
VIPFLADYTGVAAEFQAAPLVSYRRSDESANPNDFSGTAVRVDRSIPRRRLAFNLASLDNPEMRASLSHTAGKLDASWSAVHQQASKPRC